MLIIKFPSEAGFWTVFFDAVAKKFMANDDDGTEPPFRDAKFEL
jgi:hypothetical protein